MMDNLNEKRNSIYDENGFDKYGYNDKGLDINGLNLEGYDEVTAKEIEIRDRNDNEAIHIESEEDKAMIEQLELESEMQEEEWSACVNCGEPATESPFFDDFCDSCYISETASEYRD
jgi:hypothetical protein